MKTNHRIGTVALIAVCCALGFTALSLTGCDNGNDNGTPQPPQRTFTIQLLGYDVTVQDTRTGTDDQSLAELGIIAKLEAAVSAINNWEPEMPDETKAVFMVVLDRGMIIEVEKPAVVYTTDYRTKADGKTMMLDIDSLIDTPELAPNIIIGAIAGPLDAGNEYK